MKSLMKWKMIRQTKWIDLSVFLSSPSLVYLFNQMHVRAFTAEQKLQDAEDLYLKAVYRFRTAEKSQSLDYRPARREMNRLEAKLFRLRQSLYSQSATLTRRGKKIDLSLERCPEPAWGD